MHLQVTVCKGLTQCEISFRHLSRLSIKQRGLLLLVSFPLFLLEGVLVVVVEFVSERDLEDVHWELIHAIRYRGSLLIQKHLIRTHICWVRSQLCLLVRQVTGDGLPRGGIIGLLIFIDLFVVWTHPELIELLLIRQVLQNKFCCFSGCQTLHVEVIPHSIE